MQSKLTIFIAIAICSQITYSQGFWKFRDRKQKTIVKTGPYIGIQSGRYYLGEVGLERQWKEGKLKSPNTHALHFGVNYTYDFTRLNPILGYDLGYWFRKSNIGLTYGTSMCMLTNFQGYRFGITPTLGYKIWQLHIQTGYHFLYPFYAFDKSTFDANTIFLSARFVIVYDREVKSKDL
jgi:hypothetical protein